MSDELTRLLMPERTLGMLMPGLDGIGPIHRLRQMPELQAVPIIAKPFNSATLLGCLGGYARTDGSQAMP